MPRLRWLSQLFLFAGEGGDMMRLQAAISRLRLLDPEVPLSGYSGRDIR